MTLRDVLQPNKPIRGSVLKDINVFLHGGSNDGALEATPARNGRIIKAQKFISPARPSKNVVPQTGQIIGGQIHG